MTGSPQAGSPQAGSPQRIRLFSFLRAAAGVPETPGQAGTVRELLDQLVQQFGEPLRRQLFTPGGELRPDISILVNGRNIVFLDGLDTALAPGDEIALLPPAAGG